MVKLKDIQTDVKTQEILSGDRLLLEWLEPRFGGGELVLVVYAPRQKCLVSPNDLIRTQGVLSDGRLFCCDHVSAQHKGDPRMIFVNVEFPCEHKEIVKLVCETGCIPMEVESFESYSSVDGRLLPVDAAAKLLGQTPSGLKHYAGTHDIYEISFEGKPVRVMALDFFVKLLPVLRPELIRDMIELCWFTLAG